MYLVVVRQSGYSKKVFNSYAREFETLEELLEWWDKLDENCYTRTHAEVKTYVASKTVTFTTGVDFADFMYDIKTEGK